MSLWFPTKAGQAIAEKVALTSSKNLGRSPLVLAMLRVLGVRSVIDRELTPQSHLKLSDGEVLEALTGHIIDSLGKKRVPLYHLDQWMERSGLAFCYGIDSKHFNDDRFGRALDAFLPHAREVLSEVTLNLLGHFQPVVGAVHHDLTAVVLSGEYEGSELITYGYNSKGLTDKQVNVEVDVLGPEGVLVFGSPLAGNDSGLDSLGECVRQVSKLLEKSRHRGQNLRGPQGELVDGQGLTIVTDRLFADFARLSALKKQGHHFVCPLSTQHLPKGWLEQIPEEEFEPLCYRSQNDPTNYYRAARRGLTLLPPKAEIGCPLEVVALAVYSEGKAVDDRKGREKAIAKIEARLEQIRSHLNQRRYAKRQFALEQIKKALKPPFSEYLYVELNGEEGKLELKYGREGEKIAQREKVDGKYVLVSDLEEKGTEAIFCLHKEQHLVEGRHRNYKTDLALHPVWLQNETRVKALLLVYLLALMVYVLIEVLYRRATGSNITGRRVLEEFGDYFAAKVSVVGEGSAWLLSEPSAQQAHLLKQLGLPSPEITLAR